LKLVNTLLEFSRIEAGRVEATYERTDLGALTLDVVSAFRSAIEKAGLRLTTDVSELDVPVYVDRSMWEKILLNLLSNALKFTLAGKITVHLAVDRPDGGSCRWADTGVGIAADELPRLFRNVSTAFATLAPERTKAPASGWLSCRSW